MIEAQEFQKALGLRLLTPPTDAVWDIHAADVNRPGMQFCGFYEYFAFERPQVEMTYLNSMEPEARTNMLRKYFSYDIPCVICCRGMLPPPDLITFASERNVPVYVSENSTTKFVLDAIMYINRKIAPRVTRHAELVEVHGVGVLITGDSGVGKSETALELIKRGHALVADDVVDICRVSETRLIGESPAMIRHFMEIRGMGIIDIRSMYGISAVALSKSIDLVIHLEQWVEGKEYDRLGDKDEYITILGVRIPQLITPVRPGRNLAIIVEVAARNYSLKRLGYNAAHELDKRLSAMYDERLPTESTINNY